MKCERIFFGMININIVQTEVCLGINTKELKLFSPLP